jgi:hypothetical protein
MINDKLKVIATRDGRPGKPEEVGEIDGEGFSWSGTTAHLSNESARQLLALLGQGYGDREFHLVAGDTMLEGCLVARMSGTCELTFSRAVPAPR